MSKQKKEKTYKLNCIKCSTSYKQKNDPDAYYCDSCKEEKNKIADEVDKKMKGRTPKKVMSALQIHDAAPNMRGLVITKL